MSPVNPACLLDSFALLAFLNDETGMAHVKEHFQLARDRESRSLMCMVNLGEVLYIVERERGWQAAQSVLALVESLPIELLDVSRELVLDAADIKAQYAFSYADALAVAAAIREQAGVITGDPEFERVEDLVEIEWLKEE